MTAVQEPDDEELEEISEVYDMLRRDAKLMIGDLSEGVAMWKMSALMLFYLAILGFFLVWITAYPQVLNIPNTIIATVGAFGLGVGGTIGCIMTYYRYRKLHAKYSKLFEIASRLK